MGGTGVSGTTDAMAVHFNPAGMAFARSWDVQLPLFTLDAEIGGDLLAEVDDVADQFISSSLNEIAQRLEDGTATEQDLETVLNVFLYELVDFEAEDGALLRGIGGPAFRWKNWGISASYIATGGLGAQLDTTGALALNSGDFTNAIPNPPMNACGSDPFCTSFANDLVTASGGTLDQDRAEYLVSLSGPELQQDPQAQDVLIRIVEATAGGGSTMADNDILRRQQ